MYHPDDLAEVGISFGWVITMLLSLIMSSGWHTLPFLCHPDEIANFDFSQHAVALQRFHSYKPVFPAQHNQTLELQVIRHGALALWWPRCGVSANGGRKVVELFIQTQCKTTHVPRFPQWNLIPLWYSKSKIHNAPVVKQKLTGLTAFTLQGCQPDGTKPLPEPMLTYHQ